MTDTDSPVAIVTGGASGIGAAIADRLRSTGHRIAVGDVAETRTGETGGGDWAAPLDVGDADRCAEFVREVHDHFGRVDVLVNNAGVNLRGSALQTSRAEWDRILGTNLGGAIAMSTAAHPHLRDARGTVVSLASTAGQLAIAGTAAYGVSKAAIMHLTRVLALEWAADGIRVNAVAPTIVETAMTRDVLGDPDYMEQKLASIPLGRIVTREDVAEAVGYLASDAAASVTGQVLFVDGGVSIL